MKKKKILLALLLAGFSVCAGAVALTGCANRGSSNSGTNIEDPDTPLEDGSCKHDDRSQIYHRAAREATCSREGVKEHWECGKCDKLFADANLTEETTLAAVTIPEDASHHLHVNATAAKDPTCIEAGNEAYWYCVDCAKYFDDEALTHETTYADVYLQVDDEHGHKHDPNNLIAATSNKCHEGTAAHYECELCGELLDTEGHRVNAEDLVIAAQHNTYLVELVTCECNASSGGYYKCRDCGGTFADAAGTTPVTVNEQGHLLKHVPVKAATCTEDGNSTEYWYCDGGKYFSDANGEHAITKEVVAGYKVDKIAHKNKIPHAAKDPVCGGEAGNIAYWECPDCKKLFSDEACTHEITLAQTVVTKAHRLQRHAKEFPTCEAVGYEEYYKCLDCGKLYSDADGKNEISAKVEIPALGHDYPDGYTYDYNSMEYRKICANDEHHVEVQAAGTAEFPYLVNSAKSLAAALEKGGEIKLECSVQITDGAKLVINKDVNINLNGMYVVSNAKYVFEISGKAEVTIANGTIEDTVTADGKDQRVIKILDSADKENAPKVTLDGVAIEGHTGESFYGVYGVCIGKNATVELVNGSSIKGVSYGVAVWQNATLTMNGGSISGSAVGVAANGGTNHGGSTINLNNVDITVGSLGVYAPAINGVVTINGGTITADKEAALEVRAGTVTVSDAKLVSNAPFKGQPNGSGSTLEGVALGISQHVTEQPINVSVDHCTLEGVYALYEYDYQKEPTEGITITLGEGNDFKGCVYSKNTEIAQKHNVEGAEWVYNAEAGVYEQHCTSCGHLAETHEQDGSEQFAWVVANADELQTALDKGGYIKVANDIAVSETLTVSKDVNIKLENSVISSSAMNAIVVAANSGANVMIEGGELHSTSGKVDGLTLNVENSDENAPVVTLSKVKFTFAEAKVSDGLRVGKNATLTMNGCTINGSSYAVLVRGGATFNATGVVISNTECGIFSNGLTTESGAKINLTSTNVTADDVAVYLPSIDGVATISGGMFTSALGSVVEIRAGELTISDGAMLINNGATFSASANGNGTTMTGVALGISRHSTNDDITVVVSGATLEGIYAIYEEALQGGDSEISITLGEGNTYRGCVYSQNTEIAHKHFTSFDNGDENWVYNYATHEHELTCRNCGTVTETKAVEGTEADPYLANSAESLNAAIAKGGYIKLVDSFAASVVIAEGKVVNLDLNGNTLTNTVSEKPQHTIENHGTLTLVDTAEIKGSVYNGSNGRASLLNDGTATVIGVTLNREYVAGDRNTRNSYYVIENKGGEMTLEDVTAYTTPADNYSSLVCNVGAKMTIISGSYTSGKIAVKNDDNGELVIKGGTFTREGGQALQNWGKAEINGGVFNGQITTATWSNKYQSETIINGGEINGKLAFIKYVTETNKVDGVNVTTVVTNVPVLKVKDGLTLGDPAIQIEGGDAADYELVKGTEEGFNTATLKMLANDSASLKALLAEGGEIKLADNVELAEAIEITQDTTLDLNGKTLTNAVYRSRLFKVAEGVKLTVNGGNGQIVSTLGADSYGIVNIFNNAEVTLKNVNISGTVNDGATIINAANSNGVNNFTLKLDNCNVETNGYVVNVTDPQSCNIEVIGGTYNLTATTGTNYQRGFKVIAQEPKYVETCVVTFDGVTIVAEGNPIELGAKATLIDCTISTNNKQTNAHAKTAIAVSNMGDVTVKGGTYTGKYAAYVYSSGGKLTIENGTFNGDFRCDVGYDWAESHIVVNNRYNEEKFSWTGKYSESDGSAGEKCELICNINSEAEWLKFAAEHDETTVTTEKSNTTYKVTKDLDFSKVTDRVDLYHFTGTIDFGGHTVKGLTQENTKYEYPGGVRGLFVLTHDATIKNLKYELSYFGTSNAMALPVLFAWRGDVTLDNVEVSGNATHASNSATAMVYFVWANAYNSEYVNPEAVNKDYQQLAPVAIKLTFNNCTNKANITNVGKSATSGYSAAFLGQVTPNAAGNTVEFKNCVNEGTITGYHYSAMLIANQSGIKENGYLANFVVENCVNNGKIYAGAENGAALVVGPSNAEAKAYDAAYSGEGKIVNGENGVTANIAISTLAIDADGNFVINEIAGATTYKMEFVFDVRDDVDLDENGKLKHWGTRSVTIDVTPGAKVKALEFIDAVDVTEEYENNEFGLGVTSDNKYVLVNDTEYPGLKMTAQPTVYLTAYNAEGAVVGVSTCYLADALAAKQA